MAIPISSGFKLATNIPIDTRFVFDTLQEANNLDIHSRYLGLFIFITGESIYYYIKDDINTFIPFSIDNVLPAIIPEWIENSSYVKYQLITYLGKLYKAINSILSSSLTPDIDTSNFTSYSSGSGSSSSSVKFPSFTPNYSYSYKDTIVQNTLLYSAHQSFTSGTTFNVADWDLIGGDMTRNIFDINGNSTVDNAEHAIIADKALETELLQSWRPLTDYVAPTLLVYNNKAYEVTTNFTSGTVFDGSNLLLFATGDHNSLLNKQGGDSVKNEYYHLSKIVNDIVVKLNDNGSGLKYGSNIVGDMQKSVYDSDLNGIVDKATTLDGLTSTVIELNAMHGITGNVQAQFNSLTTVGNFTGTSATYAAIATTFPTPKNKDMVIVIADETHSGASSIYVNNGTSWVYGGAFTATVRNFSTNPLDINLESTGILLDARIDSAIARKTDIPNIPNMALLATYTQSNLDIFNTISNSHTHINKVLLDGYTQTNANITTAINDAHVHINESVLDKWSQDSSGNPLYNGNVIQGTGGSSGGGISDLSSFTTNDLADSSNKRYVTDSDRSNLSNLNSIVSSQVAINTNLTTINGDVPSDASSVNKLVSNNSLTTQLNGMKFFGLSDVSKTVKNNAFVMTNSTGTQVTYLQDIKALINIQKITDSSNTLFTNTPYIKFDDLNGVQNSDGTVELKLKDLYTTNLKDMPSAYDDGKILVANASAMNYELKDIGVLTNSKANLSIVIQQTDWYLDTGLGLYTKAINHNLNSTNLIIGTYDAFGNSVTNVSWSINNGDLNNVIFKSTTNASIKVIINCSQGTTGDGTGSTTTSYTPTAGDFIDDTRIRSDKTYSSQNIINVLQTNYAALSNVYTKMQSDSLYGSKVNEHTHTNLSVLNELSADSSNNLMYNGKKILTDLQAFTYQNNWTNQNYSVLTQLIDVSAIFNTNSYNAILNTEFTIKNNIASIDSTTDAMTQNQLHIVLVDQGLTLLDVLIPPSSTQKYETGISPNVKIQVQGTNFSAIYYLTAY